MFIKVGEKVMPTVRAFMSISSNEINSAEKSLVVFNRFLNYICIFSFLKSDSIKNI